MQQITDRAESNRPTLHASYGLGRILVGILLMVVGAGLFLVGFVLRLGEEMGAFRAFPFAIEITAAAGGFFTFALGVAIFLAGAALAGRRATIGVGTSMALAGIGMYVVGFFTYQPLNVVLLFAGVLVGGLGFLIIAGRAELFGLPAC
jgi:cation transport ATPase